MALSPVSPLLPILIAINMNDDKDKQQELDLRARPKDRTTLARDGMMAVHADSQWASLSKV